MENKKIHFAYFTLLLFIVLSSCSTKNSNIEINSSNQSSESAGISDFGEDIFELIVNDKYTEISKLILDLPQYRQMILSSSVDSTLKKELISDSEKDIKNDIENLKNTYDLFKTKAEKSGIILPESTLENVDFIYFKVSRIELAYLVLEIKYKGVSYYAILGECYNYKNKWYMGNSISFEDGDGDFKYDEDIYNRYKYRKSKYNQYDLYDDSYE